MEAGVSCHRIVQSLDLDLMEAMPSLQQRPVEVDVDDGADAVLPDADLVVGDADHRVRATGG